MNLEEFTLISLSFMLTLKEKSYPCLFNFRISILSPLKIKNAARFFFLSQPLKMVGTMIKL